MQEYNSLDFAKLKYSTYNFFPLLKDIFRMLFCFSKLVVSRINPGRLSQSCSCMRVHVLHKSNKDWIHFFSKLRKDSGVKSFQVSEQVLVAFSWLERKIIFTRIIRRATSLLRKVLLNHRM